MALLGRDVEWALSAGSGGTTRGTEDEGHRVHFVLQTQFTFGRRGIRRIREDPARQQRTMRIRDEGAGIALVVRATVQFTGLQTSEPVSRGVWPARDVRFVHRIGGAAIGTA